MSLGDAAKNNELKVTCDHHPIQAMTNFSQNLYDHKKILKIGLEIV